MISFLSISYFSKINLEKQLIFQNQLQFFDFKMNIDGMFPVPLFIITHPSDLWQSTYSACLKMILHITLESVVPVQFPILQLLLIEPFN